MSADPTSYELAFETRFSKKNHDARRDIGRTKKIRTNKPANPSGLPNRILVALSWNLKPGCILRVNLSLAERSIKSCPRRCDTGEDAIQEMPGQPSRSRTSAGAEVNQWDLRIGRTKAFWLYKNIRTQVERDSAQIRFGTVGKAIRGGVARRINQAATAPRSDRVALGRMKRRRRAFAGV